MSVLDVRYDPYLDAVLRDHVVRAAREHGIALDDLEDLLADAQDAIEFLKECGVTTWHRYVEDASARVDHVGWVLSPVRGRDPSVYG